MPTPIMTPDALGEPVWYALLSKPQKEDSARIWLERQGLEVWFPTEKKWRRSRYAKRQRVEYERLVAPGYVFVRFDHRPRWHVLFEEWPGSDYLRGVVCVNGRPAPISDEVLSQMAMLPGRLAKLARKRDEWARIRPGVRAQVTDGALADWVVDVQRVHRGVAWLVLPLLGREVQVAVEKLRRIE